MTDPSRSFSFDSNYDFSFRPSTYWPNTPTTEAFLSKIRGSARRDIARRALEGEELVRLEGPELYAEGMEFVLQDQLEEGERERWGSIHPAMMGGEYLPEMRGEEVEIARIELESVTADVIEVRARREDGRILYRVVDEYETVYTVSPPSSERPLTLGELIELIDTADDEGGNVGMTDFLRDMNLDGVDDPEELFSFAWVTSPFYPQLESYYSDRARAWVEEKQREPRPPREPLGPPPTPEEERAIFEQAKVEVAEMIRKSGRRYREKDHAFKNYDKRTAFLDKLGVYELPERAADGATEGDIEEINLRGLYHLPDGRMVLVRHLNVVVYEPQADG